MATFNKELTPEEISALTSLRETLEDDPDSFTGGYKMHLPLILQGLEAKDLAVRENAAGCLFLLLNSYLEELDPTDVVNLVPHLIYLLGDPSDAAREVAGAFLVLSDIPDASEIWIDKHAASVVAKCVEMTDLAIQSSDNTKTSLYELLSKFVELLPMNSVQFLKQQGDILLKRGLEQLKTIKSSAEFHCGICVGLQAVLRSLEDQAPEKFVESVAELCLKVFELPEPNDTVVAETCICFSTILNLPSHPGAPYIDRLTSIIIHMLQRNVATVESLSTFTDMGMNYGPFLAPHISAIIQSFVTFASRKDLHIGERCNLTNALADLALGSGHKFAPHVAQTMSIVAQTYEESLKQHLADLDDDADVERRDLSDLRDSVVSAYTAVVQGVSDAKTIQPYLTQIVNAILFFLRDNPTERLLETSWGLVGDVISCVESAGLLSTQHRKLFMELGPLLDEALQQGANGSLHEVLLYTKRHIESL